MGACSCPRVASQSLRRVAGCAQQTVCDQSQREPRQPNVLTELAAHEVRGHQPRAHRSEQEQGASSPAQPVLPDGSHAGQQDRRAAHAEDRRGEAAPRQVVNDQIPQPQQKGKGPSRAAPITADPDGVVGSASRPDAPATSLAPPDVPAVDQR